MKLTLRPYKPSDAAIITSWIKDEYRMRQWCADRYKSYPVTPEDMNCFHSRFMDGETSRALTMCDGDEVVGYITLRIPAEDKAEQRLGFVIIDDSKRGRGLGKALVSMATNFAFENWEPQKYRWESLKTTQLRYIVMKQWAFIVFQKRSQKVMSALVKHGNVLRW